MFKLLFIFGAALAAQSASAQGTFDFGRIPGVADQPKVQIDLNSAMLGFVAAAAREADPASGALISGIDSVRVRVYDTTDDVDELLEFIDDTSGRLESDGWQRAVYVDDEDAKVRVYMMFDGDNATGMTVMVAGEDDDDAVFVNIAGLINPTELGRLMGALGAGGALRNITGLDDADAAPEGAAGAGD